VCSANIKVWRESKAPRRADNFNQLSMGEEGVFVCVVVTLLVEGLPGKRLRPFSGILLLIS
jgi:hypothetical protein